MIAKVLNPDLYNRLIKNKSFGQVKIANAGQKLVYSLVSVGDRIKKRIIERGEAYRINCPFCGDKRQRLWLNHTWGQYDPDTGYRNMYLCICYNENCLASQENRDALYKMVYDDFSDSDPNSEIGLFNQPSIKPVIHDDQEINYDLERPKSVDLPQGFVRIDYLDSSHHAVQYLKSRNFDQKYLGQYFHVGYCYRPNNEHFMTYDRIIIPMYQEGTLVNWQARYIGEPPDKTVAKYYSAPGSTKSKILYNFDLAIRYGFVVVVEGPMDVWRFGPEAVALLGHVASVFQKRLLLSYWKKIIILLDEDAYDKALELSSSLQSPFYSEKPDVTLIKLPSGTDPADFSTEVIRETVFKAAF